MIEEYRQRRKGFYAAAESEANALKDERDQNAAEYQGAYRRYRERVTEIGSKTAAMKRFEQAEQQRADFICGRIYSVANGILEEEGEEHNDKYPVKAAILRILQPKIKEGAGGLYPNEQYKLRSTSREISIASTEQVITITGAVNQQSRHGKPRIFVHPVDTEFELEAKPSQGIIFEDEGDNGVKQSPAMIEDALQFLQIVEVFRDTPKGR